MLAIRRPTWHCRMHAPKDVMAAPIAEGIDPSRLESKDYGISIRGDNSTDAGRAQNRRIALLVTQK